MKLPYDDPRGPNYISRFADVTRSALAATLMEHEADDAIDPQPTGRRSVEIPFVGTSDQAHIVTKSIRRTMARHGYRLITRKRPESLVLWAVKDPTIPQLRYVQKPRDYRTPKKK